MGLWKKLFGPPETPMEQFARKAKAAKATLAAEGIEAGDTIRDLKRARAVIQAFGALGLQKMEGEDRIDPEIANPTFVAIHRYRDAMTAALAQAPVNRLEGANRDAAIFAARRSLAASLPRPIALTSDVVATMDFHLGLPPIDPALGLP